MLVAMQLKYTTTEQIKMQFNLYPHQYLECTKSKSWWLFFFCTSLHHYLGTTAKVGIIETEVDKIGWNYSDKSFWKMKMNSKKLVQFHAQILHPLMLLHVNLIDMHIFFICWQSITW